MKRFLCYIICLSSLMLSYGQKEFHVFPKTHPDTPGTASGTGTMTSPWDLQTALSRTSEVVNSNDTIWLHAGTYNGRFVSTLESTVSGKFITVSAYKNDLVILNGNVDSPNSSVLEVRGKQVIYKNFEITYLGEFSRYNEDEHFKFATGLEHVSGEDCKFINLKIYNIPGIGIGSWKLTGGTEINGCMVYNNGFLSKKNVGSGEGIYTQNSSGKTRVIKNCIIFNNYYKGIEVWSANKNSKNEYVKNYNIANNVIFNNGNPAQVLKDNLIVASGDKNGINIAKNIKVHSNIFYHNTDIKNREINGDAASLTIGFEKNAPVENVSVTDNLVIGKNNALRILHAKSLKFADNKVYTGYVNLNATDLEYISDWEFDDNLYYTKKSSSFRIKGDQDYTLERWKTTFGLDLNSERKSYKAFDLEPIVKIHKYDYKANTFRVVVFDTNEIEATVDFSNFNVDAGLTYNVYDVENLNQILLSGDLEGAKLIRIPMNSSDFETPLHNSVAKKTLSNFGVYIVEFKKKESPQDTEINDNLFKRFLRWLGF